MNTGKIRRMTAMILAVILVFSVCQPVMAADVIGDAAGPQETSGANTGSTGTDSEPEVANNETTAIEQLKNISFIRPADPFGLGATNIRLTDELPVFPASLDLRNADIDGDGQFENYISPIKAQAPFGSCWTFGVASAVESSLVSSGLAPAGVDVSEKHLLNALFVTDHGFDDNDPHSQNGEGDIYVGDLNSSERFDIGGFSFYITAMFANGLGPVLETTAEPFEYHGKYKNIEYRATDPELPYSYSKQDDWNIDGEYLDMRDFALAQSYMLPSPSYADNEEELIYANNAIKNQLAQGRAVSVSFCADTTLPSQEKISKLSRYLNNDNWAHYCYDDENSNHLVCIVGWDDNYPKENFAHKLIDVDDAEAYAITTPPEDGAWLVKNSWGSPLREFPNNTKEWGLYPGQDHGVFNQETGKYEYIAEPDSKQTGYFWISYYDRSLSIPEAYAFDTADSMEGYKIYQYDYMHTDNIYLNIFEVEALFANVFYAETDGRLDAVSCLSPDGEAIIKYSVYIMNEDDPVDEYGKQMVDPSYGTLVSEFERTYSDGGFHKEMLPEPVSIKKGQRFSVVVSERVLYRGSYYYALFQTVYWNRTGYESLGYTDKFSYSKGIINEGESYIAVELLPGGPKYWFDMADEEVQDIVKGLPERGEYFDLDNNPVKAYVATLEPVARQLTYNGQPQELVKPSKAVPEGYTAQYSLDGDSWSEDIPKETNVGNYTIKTRYVKADAATVSATDVSSEIKKIPVTIAAKDQHIHIGDDMPEWTAESYTVTGLPAGVSLIQEPSAVCQKNGLDAEISKEIISDYNIVPTGAALDDPENCEIIYLAGSLRMTGEPVRVAAKDVTIYTGDPLPVWDQDSYTVTGLDEGDSLGSDVSVVYYDLYNEKVDDIDTSKAGTYTLLPKGARESGKYMVGYTSGMLKITEKPAPPSPAPSGGGDDSSSGSSGAVPVSPAASKPAITKTGEKPEGLHANRDNAVPIGQFTDLVPGAWYLNGIDYCLKEGIMNGDSETGFAPDDPASRAMLITMLWRLDGQKSGAEAGFGDIPPDAWYELAVNWGADTGMINGTDEGVFSPDEPVTRGQIAAILYRYAVYKGWGFAGDWSYELPYPDADDILDYAKEAMCWMSMNGIIEGGDDGMLMPNAEATRAEIATIFMRFCEFMDK